MAPAAEGMARALEHVELKPLTVDVWSNVTGVRHHRNDPATLKKLLVEQIVSPVRWSQSCTDLIAAITAAGGATFHELAPNTVLKGLMRRIDRSTEVTSHDQPQRDHATQPTA
jgi:[acyl-carrier-protein] S-malonyltransferase